MVGKVSISQLIWFLVPGLCVVAFVLFPLGAFYPYQIASFIRAISPIGLFVFGILCGFLLDGLRVYRLRRGYSNLKHNFFSDLKKVLEVEDDNDSYYLLSMINEQAVKDEITDISFNHAIWIMQGNMAVLSLVKALVWAVLAGIAFFGNNPNSKIIFFSFELSPLAVALTSAVFSLLFLAAGWRMLVMSIAEQITTNNKFLGYARSKKKVIKERILSPE
jgi:hypothetical protein